jgi:hypothetical protein
VPGLGYLHLVRIRLSYLPFRLAKNAEDAWQGGSDRIVRCPVIFPVTRVGVLKLPVIEKRVVVPPEGGVIDVVPRKLPL